MSSSSHHNLSSMMGFARKSYSRDAADESCSISIDPSMNVDDILNEVEEDDIVQLLMNTNNQTQKGNPSSKNVVDAMVTALSTMESMNTLLAVTYEKGDEEEDEDGAHVNTNNGVSEEFREDHRGLYNTNTNNNGESIQPPPGRSRNSNSNSSPPPPPPLPGSSIITPKHGFLSTWNSEDNNNYDDEELEHYYQKQQDSLMADSVPPPNVHDDHHSDTNHSLNAIHNSLSTTTNVAAVVSSKQHNNTKQHNLPRSQILERVDADYLTSSSDKMMEEEDVFDGH